MKIILSPQAFLETFAEADYFSDVGVARLSNAVPRTTRPPGLRLKILWELRTGLRLTMRLSQ